MRVVIVPVLSDNYAYLLIDDSSRTAAAVDPAEAHLVLAKAAEEGVTITSVLTTHHHWDHAGGNNAMAEKLPGITIYGGRLDNVQGCTHPLDHDDTFTVGAVQVRALHTPGHTRGSMSFYCEGGGQRGVFTGDTLFVAGCGRVFESTPADLYTSIVEVIGALPPDTQAYVGHEYTIKNLEFAVTVDRENQDLQNMLKWAQSQRLERKFTVPSSLRNEWLINPFLRSGNESLASVCPGCSPVDVFTRLREMKNGPSTL